MGEIKPCKICGGEPVLSHSYGIALNGWEIECAKDMEFGDGSHGSGLFNSEQEAIQHWNTRHD